MGPDDQVCYCHRVTLRKLLTYARRHRPRRASQMSECLGAGTGCGWCIPMLERIITGAESGAADRVLLEVTPEQYAGQRQAYIDTKGPRTTS